MANVNRAPSAVADAASVAAQAGVWINLVGNDTDLDGDALAVTALSLSGTKGSATLDAGSPGGVTYSAGTAFNYLSAGETATDTFSYTVSDGHGGTSTAVVTVTVAGVNLAPVATNVTGATTGTSGIWFNLTGLDSDPNAHDTLSVTGFGTAGTKGTPKLNPGGTPNNGFGYSPGTAFAYLSAGETATDSFTYTISDGHGGTSTATATVTITGVNVAPVATIDRLTTDASHPLVINVLSNDTDANLHDVLSVQSLNLTGAQGSAAINADGTLTYTPGGTLTYLAAGKIATDSFTYTISDGHGGASTATVQVTVAGTWMPPVTTSDTAATDAQHGTTVNVLANDTDPQAGVSLNVASVVTTGIKGSVKINADNTLTYTPGVGFNYLSAGETATDTFSYTVSDGHGGTSTATVSVAVAGVNVAPVAPNVAASTVAGSGIWFDLTGLDSDPNAHDTLSVTGFGTAGTKGTPKLNPGGTPNNGFGYSPGTAFAYLSAGETATDSFTYTISDGHGGSSTATATVTITGVNTAPVAASDTVTTASSTPVSIRALANDTDANLHDVLSIASVGTSGTKGSVSIAADGTLAYDPGSAFAYLSAGEAATDRFTYTVSDGHGSTSTTTVTVTVTGVNQAPVASNVTASTVAGNGIWFDLTTVDSDVNAHDTLSVTGFGTFGTKGTPKLNPTPNNGFGYSPGTAFAYLSAAETATDSFTYTISDGHGGTSTATATVTVTGVNQAPVAPNVTASTIAGSGIWFDLTGLDSDVNAHDTLSVTGFGTTGTTGTPKLNSTPNNGFGYSPGTAFAYLSAGETATDSFTYTISDGHGGTSTATATITVAGVNTAPIAASDAIAATSGTPVTVGVLANDTDANLHDVLSVASVGTSTTKGSVTIAADGTLAYDPGSAFAYLSVGETATDRFTYTVSDGHGGTSTATVTVTVTGVNQAPVAPNVTASTVAGSGIWVNLTGLDSDVNAHDTLSVTGFGTTGTAGVPKLNPGGTPNNGFGYSPGTAFAYLSAGETATDSFTYAISDGHGGTSTGTATITVAGVNVAPVAASDTAATASGTPVTIGVLSNDTDTNLHDVLGVASLITTGTKGSVTIAAGGTAIAYNPGGAFAYLSAGETATDKFSYRVSDGHGGTSTAAVTVTVTGVNQAPAAPNVTASTIAGSGIWVNLIGLDSDVNAHDTLSVTGFGATGTTGTPKLNSTPNNGFGYSPGTAFAYLSAGETATDSFTYTISDGHGGTSTATATITVAGVNTAPIAASDAIAATSGTPVTVGVLANDTDANLHDVLSVASVGTSTTKGSVTIAADGTLAYDPGSAFAYLSVGETATDRFTYTVSDGHGGTSTATVTVTVTGVNQAPVAPNVTASTVAGSGIWVNLTGLDSDVNAHDTLSVTGFGTTGTAGVPKLNPGGTPNNGFGYSPGTAFAYLSAGETATDSFTYAISDGHGGTSTGTATITVAGVNVAPVAIIDRAAASAGSSVTLNVLANDTDTNLHDVLSVQSVNLTGTQGSAVVNPDGTVTYTAGGNLSYLGTGRTATDSFTYTVADGHGATSTGTAQVTVAGTWNPPVAAADNAVTDAQHAVTINSLANDTDPQAGVVLNIAALDITGTDGSVVLNQDGTVTYTPGAAFAGLVAGTATTDSFAYTLSDGHGGTSTATVTVKVTAPGAGADAPLAVYVATDGSDAWSGLLARPNAAGTDGPKASLQAAEVVMRNSAAIKTAYVEGGDYYLASPLNLGPADAGQSWLGYPGETATIHGSTVVTGWTQGANGVWTAQAPAGAFAGGAAAVDLFHDGVRATLARYPNAVPTATVEGGWLMAAPSLPGENTTTSFQFNAGDIPTYGSTSGLYVNVYLQNGWQNYTLPVSSIDYAAHTITLAGSTPFPIDQGSRYYLFNASDQLDATDEWYYDAATNTIAYKAPSGFDGSGVAVGTLSNIVSIYNTSDITIAGLTLTDSLNTGSGINVANSTGVDIAGNKITNVGVGVSFSSGSSQDTVEGNDISTTGGNGVQLPSGTHDITIVGNHIHDIGVLRASNGIWLSGSSNDVISNNLIDNVSKNGISIGSSPNGVGSYNTTVTYNEIANANQASSDGAGIYINGQYQQDLTGDLIAYNKIYGTTAAGTVGSAGVVSGGFLPASQLVSFGIYLDDYASGVTVANNLLTGNVGGIDIHSGWDNIVSGNFLVGNTGVALQNQVANALGAGNQAATGNLFTGNLVSTTNPSALASVNLGTTGDAMWSGNFYDTTVLGGRVFGSLDPGAYQANTLSAWEALGYDTGAIAGDAGFANAAGGDYTLAAGSAALAAGIANLPLSSIGLAGFAGTYGSPQTGGGAG